MSAALKVSGLRKEFGGLVAVNEVSFEVAEGEFVGHRAKRVRKVDHIQLHQRTAGPDGGHR